MTDTEFAEAKQFWLMFQANETFKAVQQACLELVHSGISDASLLYYPLIAGIICLYGKPFKRSAGVGKLPIEMVPEEQLDLHKSLLVIRDKLYAHSDAQSVKFGQLHMNELRCYRWPNEGGYFIDRLNIAPSYFNLVAELAAQMTEKTQYHVDKLAKKFTYRAPRRLGEFLLNIQDQNGPLFTQVEPARPRERLA
jgi:hypothetical protein